MKIHIVGPGVVGKATGEGFARFGHQVVYTDKDDDHSKPEADVRFICTPEGVVDQVVKGIAAVREDHSYIVVRSTVPPGTCKRLAVETGTLIWHNPEWLREATSEMDFLNTRFAIIGDANPYPNGELNECPPLNELYTDMRVPIFYCLSDESEMAKIVMNGYLATQISFWNDIKDICDGIGLNSHKVARLVTLDPRVSPYGAFAHGKPFGGKCLPKDLRTLIRLTGHGLSPPHIPVVSGAEVKNMDLLNRASNKQNGDRI